MRKLVNSVKDKILIVDDEWESPIVKSVRRRLDEEGWETIIIQPDTRWMTGDEFEAGALYAIEEQQPHGVLLDVRLGEYKEDRFKGLEILQKIVQRHPHLPVLMFTQYTQGPERETAVRGSLKWDSQVDFIDKLASPEEVVLRLRRLIGRTPEAISIGTAIHLDLDAKLVHVKAGDCYTPVSDIHGMKFEILKELATTWYRSPGELVPFSRLERYSEGEEARASLRVRIREIKVSLGNALGVRFGASDLIINVRDQGYRLVPPSR
jgi:DNA-binding response OmpR family regulator